MGRLQFVEKFSSTRVFARIVLSKLKSWYNSASFYQVVAFYPGIPAKPLDAREMEALMKKAGVELTAEQYSQSRNALTELVTTGVLLITI
jgi:hypothetical protein